jgi:hypothetical protein
MRHSSLHLTTNVYTDPMLLDVGASEALPELALRRAALPRVHVDGARPAR